MDSSEYERVLQFWFGGNQQINYKTKWFPDGSTDLQGTADRLVYEQFGQTFSSAVDGQLDHWRNETKSCVALIVVLDQFSRHVCRLLGKTETTDTQKSADKLALEVAKQLHESRADELLNLSVAEYVFSLMPLRHTATVGNLSYVLECLKGKEEAEARSLELLHRFRKQTVRRLQHLQDRERLEATADILEREAFRADEADIMNHPLVRATEAFLLQQLGEGYGGGKGERVRGGAGKSGRRGTETAKNEAAGDGGTGAGAGAEGPDITLLISLSGGVDSMVLSKILRLLQRHRPQLRIARITAMHIDYGNRPESAAEAAYVRRWCEGDGVDDGESEGTMLGGVTCRVRRVDEVTRGVTARDEYEKVSRDIRYGFYRTCIQEEHERGAAQGRVVLVSGVIFGHHLGDVQENVVSNVLRGSGPLQLSGMTASSVSNGVTVWRPLLAHPKEQIYEFAHRYGVPYFKDSTPSWSTRGKLRNQLLPLLIDMYGAGCLQNLAQLAGESDATRDLVQANLYEPFLRSVQRGTCGVSVPVLPYRQQPQCFWREALRQLMHSMNMGLVRDSAVGNFLERLQRPGSGKAGGGGGGSAGSIAPGWLELRKGVHTFLTAQGDLLVLRDGVFRKGAATPLSSTALNQRRQQTLAQAKKAAAAGTAQEVLQEALRAVQRQRVALQAAAAGLVRVRVDASTGRLSCADDALPLLQRLCCAEYPGAESTASGCTEGALQLGPWRIECCLSEFSAETSKLHTLSEVLDGRVKYEVIVRRDSAELQFQFQRDLVQTLRDEVLLQEAVVIQLGGELPASDSADAVPSVLNVPECLSGADVRVRTGLPLLLPVAVEGADAAEPGVARRLLFALTCTIE